MPQHNSKPPQTAPNHPRTTHPTELEHHAHPHTPAPTRACHHPSSTRIKPPHPNGWEPRQHFLPAAHQITVKRVLTDNRSCYRSKDFAVALGPVVHKRTSRYRPQTNGKVERFNRTLAAEWAYGDAYTSEAARTATYRQ
ncbi:integrase-like protein [Rhodococcus sp. AG1013]|nr:integrase-like protein [Rhodococcus sp. AG1013]